MTETVIETKTKVCSDCKRELNAAAKKCGHCGLAMTTPQEERFLGAIMMFFGIVNVASMSWLMSLTEQSLKQTGKLYPGFSQAASPEEKTVVFAAFGAFLAFGLVLLGVGAWRLKTGKCNWRLEFAVVCAGAAFWFLSEILTFFL